MRPAHRNRRRPAAVRVERGALRDVRGRPEKVIAPEKPGGKLPRGRRRGGECRSPTSYLPAFLAAGAADGLAFAARAAFRW
jgi:hypothetical protein